MKSKVTITDISIIIKEGVDLKRGGEAKVNI